MTELTVGGISSERVRKVKLWAEFENILKKQRIYSYLATHIQQTKQMDKYNTERVTSVNDMDGSAFCDKMY